MIKLGNYTGKIIFSLVSFSFFLGLFLALAATFGHINLDTEDMIISPDEDSEEIEKLCGNECSLHEDARNVGRIPQKINGSLYSFNKPNVSGKFDRLGLNPFYVDTNSKGLRDEEFQAEKPKNITRVLVLGTSTTFGFGVERNQTFVERTEAKLNGELPRDIQILNAGSQGYGMEDYYYYLKTRGINYHPDLVVVASNSIIWRSREDADDINRLAARKVQRDDSNISEAERRQKIRDFVAQELQNRLKKGIENTGMRYIYEIQRLTSKHNIDLVYYSINGLPYSGQKKYIESWGDQTGEEVYYAPREYRQNSEKYDHSDLDTHPDAEGHKIISRGLYSALLNELEAKVLRVKDT